MKTKNVWMFLLLLATCFVGSSVFCSCSKDDVEDTPPAGSNTTDNKDTHEYVDLGLPSGTLWATCNVGAAKPELYGYLFAWGETQQKTNYSWSTYKYCKGTSSTMTKYCSYNTYGTIDGKTELEAMDDAATANWGSDWKTPNYEQLKELFNNFYTTTSWTTLNGLSGTLIISRSNGNRIFLPAAGYSSGQEVTHDGSEGCYWSCSNEFSRDNEANALRITDDDIDWDDPSRYYGLSVRPVRVQGSKVIPVASIELNKTELLLVPKAFTQLTVTIQPWYATNKNLKWESSNKSIATVDETGKVTALAVGTCTITCSATDGSGIKAECKVTVPEDNSGTIDGRDYVDLGLPSGTLWASCNVGANSPDEYGDYFAWGETQPKRDYNWDTYKYGGEYSITKYCTYSECGTVDNKIELEPSDDAATANWGSDWQMPSREQCDELYNNSYTIISWTYLNNSEGLKITSKKNGNSIFLPATSNSGYGRLGYYWSRSLYASDFHFNYFGYSLYFNSSDIFLSNNYRYTGLTIRPVRVQK